MVESAPRYRPTAVIEQVGVVRANRASEQAWGDFAASAGRISGEFLQERRREVLDESERAGATAGIQRDAEGRLIFNPVEATDDAARAFNRGGQAAYLAAFANDAAGRASALALKHDADPDGFQNAWSGHIKGAIEGVPERLRPEAQIYLDQQGRQHFSAIAERRVQQDRALQAKSIATQVSSLDADILSLARAGKIEAPEYLDAMTRRRGLVDSQVAARFITQEMAQEADSSLSGAAKAQAFIGDVMTGYRARKGGPEAARWALTEADKIVREPGMLGDLSPGQREQFRNLLQSEVREAEQLRRIGWDELDRRFSKLDDDIAFGVVPKGLAALGAEAKALGHAELMDKVERVQRVGQAAASFSRMPLQDQSQKVEDLRDRWLKGDLNQTERDMFVAYERTHQRAVREIQADPVGYAMKAQGDVPADQRIVPLSFDDLAALPAQLERRADQMRVAQGRVGYPMPMLTKEEARLIGATVTAPDDPAASQTASRRFEMLRPIIAAAKTDEQKTATQRALSEAKITPADLYATDPEVVAHLGVTGARFLFGALATKDVEMPADVKKKMDTAVNELWLPQYEFNAKQAAITGDGTVQRRQEVSHQMLRKASYAYGDAAKGYNAVFGASALLEGDDYALRLPKPMAEDRAMLERGMRAAREGYLATIQPDDALLRRQITAATSTAKWANDRSGEIGLYVGGAKLMGISTEALLDLGRRSLQAEAQESSVRLEANREAAQAARDRQPRRALDLNFGRPVR